jgi:hypothetical protein
LLIRLNGEHARTKEAKGARVFSFFSLLKDKVEREKDRMKIKVNMVIQGEQR